MIKHYYEEFLETIPFLRSDNGFSAPSLYELCEKGFVSYVIRLKANVKLIQLTNELHPTNSFKNINVTECSYEETVYQAASWTKLRKVIIQSV